jgi:hypothetical protein
MANSATRPNKKVYQTPKLLRYGNLTEMTLAISMRGSRDSATKSRIDKTG